MSSLGVGGESRLGLAYLRRSRGTAGEHLGGLARARIGGGVAIVRLVDRVSGGAGGSREPSNWRKAGLRPARGGNLQ